MPFLDCRSLPLVLALGAALLPAPASAAAPAQRPNVVLIVLDDMNGWLSRRDYPALQVPHLDQFRGQALNFVNAACSVTVCSPSRASFLSGLHPSTGGAYLNGADPWDKPGSRHGALQSLPEFFKARGYLTWGGGKLFHSPLPRARLAAMFDVEAKARNGFGPFPDAAHRRGGNQFAGVQPWTGPDTDFPDVENADQAVDFLGRPQEKPFLLFYGLWRPHTPYTAPRRFFDLYSKTRFDLPAGWQPGDLADIPPEGRRLTDGLKRVQVDGRIDEDRWREELLGYCANTSFADWNIGRVLAALDHGPHAANTLVVITSDNGFHCGPKERWEKGTLWELSAHVPLLVRGPGVRRGTSPRTVSLVDLYPTLAGFCGLGEPAHRLDGRSFVPLLRDPAAAWDRPSFTAYGKGNGSIRDERYRLIRYHDGTEELYDHASDPHEFNNLAGRPDHAAIAARLRRALPDTWAPSWGGRWEVPRPGEPARYPPEYALPPGYRPKSRT
jgi:arylsulfatase A-like enzyme